MALSENPSSTEQSVPSHMPQEEPSEVHQARLEVREHDEISKHDETSKDERDGRAAPRTLSSQNMVAGVLTNRFFQLLSCTIFLLFVAVVSVEFSFGFPQLQMLPTEAALGLFIANVVLLSFFFVETWLKIFAFSSVFEVRDLSFAMEAAIVVGALVLDVISLTVLASEGNSDGLNGVFVAGNLFKQSLILFKIRQYEFIFILESFFKVGRERMLVHRIQSKLMKLRSNPDLFSDDVAHLNWIIYILECQLRIKRSIYSSKASDNKPDFSGLDEETKLYLLETYSRDHATPQRTPLHINVNDDTADVETVSDDECPETSVKQVEHLADLELTPKFGASRTSASWRKHNAMDLSQLQLTPQYSDDSIMLPSGHISSSGHISCNSSQHFDDVDSPEHVAAAISETSLSGSSIGESSDKWYRKERRRSPLPLFENNYFTIPEGNESKVLNMDGVFAEDLLEEHNASVEQRKLQSYLLQQRSKSFHVPKKKRSSVSSVVSAPCPEIQKLCQPQTNHWLEYQTHSNASTQASRRNSKLNRHITGERCGLRETDVNKLSTCLLESLSVEKLCLEQEDLSKLNQEMDEWEFDVFELSEVTHGHPLSYVASAILRKNDLYSQINLDEATVHNFLVNIEAGYRKENPYHNAIHAADVVQTIHYFFTYNSLRDRLKADDVLCAIISGAIHDYQHPGVNNSYLAGVKSAIALRYNDRSVLEHMHVSSAFQLMVDKPECDILACYTTRESYLSARESIIQMVLATDMSHHFEGLEEFKNKLLVSPAPKDPPYSPTGGPRLTSLTKRLSQANVMEDVEPLPDLQSSIELRRILLNTTIHCADLSNPAKPPDICHKWAYLVQEEMFLQGDKERDLGIPVSMFMDRKKATLNKCQIGFLTIIVKPLFAAYCQFVPGLKHKIEHCIDKNLAYWQRRQDMLDNTRRRNSSSASGNDLLNLKAKLSRKNSAKAFLPQKRFTFFNQARPLRRASDSPETTRARQIEGRRASAKVGL